MTKTLPTNKRGQIYYGATTLKEALERSCEMDAKETLEYAEELRENGYTWIAGRMLNTYGGRKELEAMVNNKD